MTLQIEKDRYHHLQPDYERPVLKIPPKISKILKNKLSGLYGSAVAAQWLPELERILKVYYACKTEEMIRWERQFNAENRFTEYDVILITYGDLIRNAGEQPLKTLGRICHEYFNGVFNTIHILPFFPYSSDRGFSVMDFEEVDPNLGTWDDILDLKRDYNLMFDGVFNHVSSKSRWFQEFLNQNPDYLNFFTVFSTKDKISQDHLKLIVRPRTSDVLSSYNTLNGLRMVWTTFSADQIDLNYNNPKVLMKMIEILLTYVRRGADLIRLDAVTYLWEELGTSCAHLEQNHIAIRLFRDVLNLVAPHVALITETNVSHKDNIRYFGNGKNEAQMVYNFALPPLVLHAFQTGNASRLTAWASGLKHISNEATYFNFLDSHDGIGVMAVKDILSKDEIELMALKVLEHGGYISYKDNGDGTRSPYELNITWYSAINNEDADEPRELQVKRYIASRSIALVLKGVPGIYFHGLLGSKNDAELVIEQRETRSINRKNINKQELVKSLNTPDSSTALVTKHLKQLIQIRKKEPAFHPNAAQKTLNLHDGLFSLVRLNKKKDDFILTLVNITSNNFEVQLPLIKQALPEVLYRNIISDTVLKPKDGNLLLHFKPYEVMWLKVAV